MKKRIIIVIVSVAIGLSFGFITYKIFNKNDKAPITKEIDADFEEYINKINEINAIFLSENLSDKEYLENNIGMPCYQYKGDDYQDYINKLQELYINPLDTYYFRLFRIKTDENGNEVKQGKIEELYVCKDENSEYVPLTSDKYKWKENDLGDYLEITEGNEISTYELQNVDGQWKFTYPIVIFKEKEKQESN